MKINKYPDGTSYVTIPKEWEDTHQEITFKVNNYEDLHHLHQLCEVLIWSRVTAHILIPNLLDAQADKRFGEFSSSGLKTIVMGLNIYKGISFGVFHPHNAEVVEALFDSVEVVDNTNYIARVLINLGSWDAPNNLMLMSADAGGFKPLIKLCDKLDWEGDTYSASKSRTKDGLKQLVDRQDFGGKDILIVDDISVYGGTFKGLSKLLKQRNCGKLYLAVSHMTVQNLGEDPVTNYFDKVFTTNSKFDEYNWGRAIGNGNPKNLEIIKLF